MSIQPAQRKGAICFCIPPKGEKHSHLTKNNNMKTKKKTVTQIIAGLLKSGKCYTLSALTKATNSTKVSTRISDLRQDGWVIRNTITRNKAGEITSKYKAIYIPNN